METCEVSEVCTWNPMTNGQNNLSGVVIITIGNVCMHNPCRQHMVCIIKIQEYTRQEHTESQTQLLLMVFVFLYFYILLVYKRVIT